MAPSIQRFLTQKGDSLNNDVFDTMPREMPSCIKQAVAALSSEEVEIVEWRYFRGLSIAEIADLLQVTKETAERRGQVFADRLSELKENCDLVEDVRVLGMMIGLQLNIEGTPVVQGCMEKQLLVNCTQSTVIRLLPALNVTEEQVHEGCDILAEVIKAQAA